MDGNEADYMEDASELEHCHAVFDLPRQPWTDAYRRSAHYGCSSLNFIMSEF